MVHHHSAASSLHGRISPRKGQYLPVSAGRGFVDAAASRTARIESRYRGRDTVIVQENQMFRRFRADEIDKLVALGGVKRLFSRRTFSRLRTG
jgi:hypothetical protein